MQYRPEIDGLRSLAILPVILFHANFSWIPGGLLGVDVFFVISGYLISSIIITEKQQNRFSLAHFYERRARRILPALFFVLLCSSIAAWFILAPGSLIEFSYSVIAVVGFVANIFFWQNTGYFDGDAALKPLLHMWSLGVEEQFYLLFPILLMAGYAKPKHLKIGLVFLFIVSLLAAQLAGTTWSSASFYLLPMRAWELLAGVACAYYLQNAIKASSSFAVPISQAGSLIGLGLLIVSFFTFSPALNHPSFWTLIPVIGTVFIIIFAKPNTWVAQLLSLKPLVGLGLLSYSAYLWHQPLFAFTRLTTFSATLSLTQTIILIIATFLLAAISWKWVESPFRKRTFLHRKTIFTSSLIGIILFMSAAGLIIYKNGYPQRFNNIQQILMSYAESALTLVGVDPCFLSETDDSSQLGESCRISPMKPIVILGDSHASALWFGLNEKMPIARYSSSGCAPLLGEEISVWRPFCPAVNQFNFEEVKTKQPPIIILHANWILYRNHLTGDDPNQVLIRQIYDTINYLHKIAPRSRIYLVGDAPQWPPSLVTILSHYAKDGMPNEWLANSMYEPIKALDDVIRLNTPAPAQFISLLDLLCKPDGQCRALLPIEEGWAPTTWDANHLSQDASKYIAEKLDFILSLP